MVEYAKYIHIVRTNRQNTNTYIHGDTQTHMHAHPHSNAVKKTHRVHRENDRSQRMSSCVNSRPTLRDVTHHLSEDGATTTTITTTAYGTAAMQTVTVTRVPSGFPNARDWLESLFTMRQSTFW